MKNRRRNHGAQFKAQVALAAAKGDGKNRGRLPIFNRDQNESVP